ncbi:uncharacterized protein I303_105058 [Kwoniella dejecticola CBS 10117]|uniref:Uncharacterized protein n=1 Tax=Kwoniella dejecticola CBS 10117 TaxID=1296121 RepID=A0A1A6A3K1_9TREE|nr:uncharacterized protein I303_05496 [Kwoniella dejecticola CBS 10117]OBR84637.1 hypothetical protein I303_05496 [Kwoniella dejecticola CBS 10117]
MSFPRRPLLLGISTLSTSFGITYILNNEIKKLTRPAPPSLSSSTPTPPSDTYQKNPYPISRLYPEAQTQTQSQTKTQTQTGTQVYSDARIVNRDPECGLMLPAHIARKAEEEDNLIENGVLYLG